MVVQPPSSASDEAPSTPRPRARIVMASLPIIGTLPTTISPGPHLIVDARGFPYFHLFAAKSWKLPVLCRSPSARAGSAIVQSARGIIASIAVAQDGDGEKR